jgi:TatD DNase family protein
MMRSDAAGVKGFLCIGYAMEMNRRAIELAEKYPQVVAAIGLHPSEAETYTDQDLDWLESKLNHPKVVAIGEIGLDYYRGKNNVSKQKELFIKQIRLANKWRMPMCIHMREATDDTLQLLRDMKDLALPGVMHCYSGSVESARDFIALNMKISLAGPVTFLNARVPKAVAKAIELEHLLIETDAPYLAPMPYRGKPNQPEFLPLVANEIALIKEVPLAEVARITWKNAVELFHIQQ